MKRKFVIGLLCLLSVLLIISCDEAKHEHTYGTEWEYDKTNHWHVCTICKEPGEKTAHTFGEWKASTTEGKVVRACDVCGAKEEADGYMISTLQALGEFFTADEDKTAFLGGDITITGETVTSKGYKVLNLNGKTIKNTTLTNIITNEGTLEVLNGTIDSSSSWSAGGQVISNNKVLKTTDVVIKVKATSSSTTDENVIVVIDNLSGAELIADNTEVYLEIAAGEGSGLKVKPVGIYSNDGTKSTITDSKIEVKNAIDGSTYGFYILNPDNKTVASTAAIENTTISVECSQAVTVCTVFAESYTNALRADITLKKCEINGKNTYGSDHTSITYGVRAKGPSTVTLDPYTRDHITLDPGKGKKAELCAEVQNWDVSSKDQLGEIKVVE